MSVTRGGVFDPPVASYSPETADMLRELMRESCICDSMQKKLQRNLLSQPKSKKTRAGSAPPTRKMASEVKKNKLDAMQRKRSAQLIREITDNEDTPAYCPPHPKYTEGSKRRCQDLMSGQAQAESIGISLNRKKRIKDLEERKNGPEETTKEQLIKQKTKTVCQEVSERISWIKEMEDLGCLSKDDAITMNAQLATRLRFLKTTEKKK